MKSLINPVLLREQLKRYWAIGVLSFLVYLLFCILPMLGTSGRSANYDMIRILEMKNPFIILLNIIAPLSAVIAIFSYIYQHNAAGVIHALPFTKKQLFTTNILAGYILIVLPLFLFSALLLVMPVRYEFGVNLVETETYIVLNSPYIAVNIFPNGLKYGDIINSFPVVCGFFAKTLLSFTFYYILFIIASMIAGNQISALLMSAILPFLALGFYVLFVLIAYYFVYGFYIYTDIILEVLVYTNPLALTTIFENVPAGRASLTEAVSLLPYIVSYVMITIMLMGVSVWLYHTRRLERAGDTVVFDPMKKFFILALSVFGMVSLGSFLLVLMRSVVFMYVGFVIGFVIAFFIAQMITEKTFNVFYKYKGLVGYGGAVVVIFVAILLVTGTDIAGYERFKPNEADISGVFIGRPYEYEEYMNSNTKILDMMFVNDREIINETLDVHQRIIDGKKNQRKVFLDDLEGNYRAGYTLLEKQGISYRLKNGKIITRSYMLSQDFVDSAGLSRLKAEEQIIMSSVFWMDNPEDITRIELNPYRQRITAYADGNSVDNLSMKSITIYEKGEILSLISAIRQDYIDLQRSGEPDKMEQPDVPRFYVGIATGIINDGYFYTNINYGNNTVAWLDAHGYKLEDRE